MAAGKLTLGYVLSPAVAEDVFMGGAMVTDASGLPLEFRYTEPVRATKLQRILYGDVLRKVYSRRRDCRQSDQPPGPEAGAVSCVRPCGADAVQASGRKAVQLSQAECRR